MRSEQHIHTIWVFYSNRFRYHLIAYSANSALMAIRRVYLQLMMDRECIIQQKLNNFFWTNVAYFESEVRFVELYLIFEKISLVNCGNCKIIEKALPYMK